MSPSIRPVAPVLVMVLAATAVPIGLHRPDLTQVSFVAYRSDVILNITGYLPVGFVLARLGPMRVAAAAAAIAMFVEASQLFMVHRQPSTVDVVCNAIGATLGVLAFSRVRTTALRLTVDRRVTAVAAALALVLVLFVWWRAPLHLNDRGSTSAGALEANWRFDESEGPLAIDSSGHGFHGTFSNEPKRVPGIVGTAARLNGVNDYVQVGRASAFRLVGSMTLSAWINMAQSSADDAAIVSTLNGVGYQLDTTVDRGLRTVGFKLGNACGQLMARYGATPLVVGKWYHIAGVYDAPAKTLDVYVDGRLDNGFQLGSVTGAQHSSREAVYVGRRSSDSGFEFAGLIDDVRIYSRALTAAEIHAVARGILSDAAVAPSRNTALRNRPETNRYDCSGRSDREDAQIPGAAGGLGILVAVLCVAFWPAAGLWRCFVASGVAGLFLLLATAPSLPILGRCLIPLTSLAGTASVVIGLHDRNGHP